MTTRPSDADAAIRYLNTDLELTSARPLEALAAALEARGLYRLYVGPREDAGWFASFEVEGSHEAPEDTIAAILDAVEPLDGAMREMWDACTTRMLNLGYDCGRHPRAFEQDLSAALLARVVAAGASLRITLYAAETTPDPA